MMTMTKIFWALFLAGEVSATNLTDTGTCYKMQKNFSANTVIVAPKFGNSAATGPRGTAEINGEICFVGNGGRISVNGDLNDHSSITLLPRAKLEVSSGSRLQLMSSGKLTIGESALLTIAEQIECKVFGAADIPGFSNKKWEEGSQQGHVQCFGMNAAS